MSLLPEMQHVEPGKLVTGSPGVVLLVPSAVIAGQENPGCVARSDLGVGFLVLLSAGAFMGGGIWVIRRAIVKNSELSGIQNTS